MSWSTLKVAEILETNVIRQSIGINGFAIQSFSTFGYVMVDLNIRGIRSPTHFHIIDANTFYHLLIGRPWVHRHEAILSTLYQCMKAHRRGRDYNILTSKYPFS
ncbi:hypothetical protein CFOL_v3_17140 [Cephalotus follicularis]|uniref:Uncharacterized protein n=1 Tax=Cephalotus follicularis TaxID=3775 RepID=A0A1Q3C083_CEPFO|nr:hypothetical protein CFOL_v3_17140 [Cephalotus follicularis]